nr:immunoglobulin light chain junction region [Macaca mulatta]
CVQGSDWPFTF